MEASRAGPQNSNSPPGASERPLLSERQAEAVTSALADATGAGLPLADALRAAADEATDRHVADELSWLASQIEAGRPLDEILTSRQAGYPGYVGALVQAALRTGRVGESLVELLDCQRTRREMWWSIKMSLAYPLVLVIVATVIGVGISVGLMGSFVDMFADMESDSPPFTNFFVWFQQTGVFWAIGLSGLVVVAATLLRLLGGAARWSRVVATLPLVGPLWHWSGIAELARLLGVLLEQDVPLPDALRLAASAAWDANVREVGGNLAAGAEQGGRLSELMSATPRVPASLVPIVRWGERAGQLPEAFRVAAEMFEGRLQMRAELVRTILPPLVFVAVACSVLMLLAGLFLPMISMIQSLSFGPAPGAFVPTEVMNPLNYVAAAVLGAALLWAVKLVYGGRGASSDDLVKRLMLLAGWILLLAGTLGVAVGVSGPLAPLPLLGAFFAGFGYFKYVTAERQALLWALAVAAEKEIPLEQAARAFADERAVQIGIRVSRLADLLESGVPLPTALALTRNPLPADALLAARLGLATDRLGPALRISIRHSDFFGRMMREVLGQIFYLVGVLLAGSLVILFTMLKIVPVFTRMFEEFELELPAVTQFNIAVANDAAYGLPLVCPVLLILLLVATSYFVRWSRYELPGFNWIWLRSDAALVMRALALTVQLGQALGPALRLLAQQYPRPSVGKRLQKAAERVEQGEHWCHALRSVRLLTGTDVGVLKAAERVGNLGWALEEVSEGSLRRWALRWKVLVNVAFPFLILALGMMVMFIVVGLFIPLVALIQGLS